MFRLPRFGTTTKILISLLILGIVASRLDTSALFSLVHDVYLYGLLFSGLFFVFQIFLLSWRWGDLMIIGSALPREPATYVTAANITLSSLLANILFITSISGMVVRVALSVRAGLSLAASVCATIIDRLMTLLALALLAALFLPFLEKFVDPELFRTAYATTAVFTFCLLIFAPVLFGRSIIDFIRGEPKLAGCLDYLKALAVEKSLFVRMVIVSLTAQIFYFIAVYFIALSTGAQISFISLLCVLPVITLIASLPISIGGWGVREGAFVYGLGLIGIPEETAFLISVQIGLLTMISTIVAGLPSFVLSDTGRALKAVNHKT